jgi:pimeloyl-ACP methyl ester carboxylesterase
MCRTSAIRGVALQIVFAVHCLVALPTTAFAQEGSAPGRRTAVTLSPCSVADLAQPARCGVLNAPENPDTPEGRRLDISIVVIPATAGPARADPIVVLMGGPGEDAMLLASARKERDLLLVDQRGTGKSAALRCALYSPQDPAASLRDLFPLAPAQKCERRLRAQADLTQYMYLHFANDLEQVRRALGYGPLNLFAGSYGTRAAQVFVRAYPQSVRTIFMGSVVPILATSLTMAKTAQSALEDLFRACADDSACHVAFPDLRDEFRQVVARLESGNVRVTIPGQSGSAQLHRGRVVEWFRSRLYRPTSAATLPWLIHQAYEGNWNPIAEGILSQAREIDPALSLGLLFSITCSEDLAFVSEEDIVRETQGLALGDYRVRQQQAVCRQWPKASLPPDYRLPVRSAVPTLFVSGDTDAASPLWFTEQVAAGFSNRAEIVLAGRGHTDWSDCVLQVYERFVRAGTADAVKGASCEPTPRPPFKTR